MKWKIINAVFLLTLIVEAPQIVSAQSEYSKFLKALLKGDTVTAMEIEKRNVTIEPIEEKPFRVKNLPEKVFHFNIHKLRDTVVALFDFKNQYDNKFLQPIFYNKNVHQVIFSAETTKDSLFSKSYFNDPATANDIYIHAFGETWLSKFYFSKGKPLRVRTAFIIKLSAQNDSSVKVVVVAEKPKALNGISGFGFHGPIARETEVNSSTIEEYSLLLFIEDKLGDHGLTPLKLPGNK
jgi:hypothetical protein